MTTKPSPSAESSGRPPAATALLGLLAFSLLTGCGPGGGGPPPDQAVSVQVQKPVLEAVEETISAVGSVEANERVELKPEAAGVIDAIHFVEGSRVKQGAPLFTLDARKEAAAVAQAQAETTLARSSLERARQLAGTKAISQQELDQLASQLAVRDAIIRVDQERLADREVLAPFDGVLGPRLVSAGQYVNVGTPLAVLVDDSKVKVRFRIPERQIGRVRPGQTGRLRVNAYPDREFTGTVDLVSPEVDETTRTAEIRLLVENPQALLRPGLFARVELIVGRREQAVVVPEAAIVPSLDRYSVYAVDGDRARKREVKLGIRMPGKVEITAGLEAGQEIVVSGQQKLVDGSRIAPAQPAAAGAAGSR
jgi:membrane fusion protein (multidrug efflux system)